MDKDCYFSDTCGLDYCSPPIVYGCVECPEFKQKPKPILFSSPMVQAIKKDRKTMTRRVTRYEPYKSPSAVTTGEFPIYDPFSKKYFLSMEEFKKWAGYQCKYKVGDILWVRETWGNYYYDDPECNAVYFMYRADYPDGAKTYKWPELDEFGEEIICDLPKWRPSIFMPREAARLFLRVTDVRAERLQDISEEDAKAEGIGMPLFTTAEIEDNGYVDCFASLWDWISLKRGFGWDTNPWVWVITFERIEKPGWMI